MAEELGLDWFKKVLKNTPQPNALLCGDSNFSRWQIPVLGGATVMNGGRNGNTASMYWARLRQCQWPKNPGGIFVMFGTNDARNGVPLATYGADYRSIVRLCKSHAPTLVVGILPHELPFDPSLPVSETNFNTVPYDAVAERIAGEEGVAYIRTSDAFPASGYTMDGIHLTAAGQCILQSLLEAA